MSDEQIEEVLNAILSHHDHKQDAQPLDIADIKALLAAARAEGEREGRMGELKWFTKMLIPQAPEPWEAYRERVQGLLTHRLAALSEAGEGLNHSE